MKRPTDYPKPTLVLGGFTFLVVVCLLVATSTSSVAFGAYNGAWDGTSDLRSVAKDTGANSRVIHDTSAYSHVEANSTVGIILSPVEKYSTADRARLQRFVRHGGTLLVAGDYGSQTNQLLSALGTDARLDGHPVRDERHHYRSPVMPIADNVSNQSLVSNVSGLTLNHGTVVSPRNATVLVSTSEYAYLDVNRNQKLDDNESISSMPVATIERIGAGQILVVSDPSILINTMLDHSGNQAFVRTVVGNHRTVLLDYSHTAQLPPLALAVLILRESGLLQLLVGSGCLFLVLLWAQRPETVTRRWNSLVSRIRPSEGRPADLLASRPSTPPNDAAPSMSESAMIIYLQEQHPDWDAARIQRIITTYREERSD